MAKWNYIIRSNKPKNWRQKLTGLVHRLMDRFDGRITVSLEYSSEPAISRREFVQCMLAGQKHAEMLLSELVKSEAIEVVLNEALLDSYGQ